MPDHPPISEISGRLRPLLACSTPGPWNADGHWVNASGNPIAMCPDSEDNAYDPELIAEMRNALPAILDALDARLPAQGAGDRPWLASPAHVALWDAINDFAAVSGVRREEPVVRIEHAVSELIRMHGVAPQGAGEVTAEMVETMCVRWFGSMWKQFDESRRGVERAEMEDSLTAALGARAKGGDA